MVEHIRAFATLARQRPDLTNQIAEAQRSLERWASSASAAHVSHAGDVFVGTVVEVTSVEVCDEGSMQRAFFKAHAKAREGITPQDASHAAIDVHVLAHAANLPMDVDMWRLVSHAQLTNLLGSDRAMTVARAFGDPGDVNLLRALQARGALLEDARSMVDIRLETVSIDQPTWAVTSRQGDETPHAYRAGVALLADARHKTYSYNAQLAQYQRQAMRSAQDPTFIRKMMQQQETLLNQKISEFEARTAVDQYRQVHGDALHKAVERMASHIDRTILDEMMQGLPHLTPKFGKK